MDEQAARSLIALNRRFYDLYAESFSATREAPWPGWLRVLDEALEQDVIRRDANKPVRILDVAAGNLRFERFLADKVPDMPLEFTALDSCAALADSAAPVANVDFAQVDILAELLAGRGLPVTDASFDLVVCFGFMHHVPGEALREALMRELARAVRPHGIVAVSFWQFMDEPRLAAKAREADVRAASLLEPELLDALDPNDHFLGWQDDPEALRYCHHFSEPEIDRLAAGPPLDARELVRFHADGRSGHTNRYLLLSPC